MIFSFYIILGLLVAYYFESFFRIEIQKIFRWSTNNHIQFVGKNFHIFNGSFYYLSFAFSFLSFGISNQKLKIKRIIINTVIAIVVFALTTIILSSFEANAKVIECTACENGVRQLHWNEINYDFILGISILISIIPSLITFIRNHKNQSQRTTTVHRQ